MSISDLISLLPSLTSGISEGLDWQQNLNTHGLFLAQHFENVNIVGNLQTAWDDFLQSGKAGALAIGLVIGYLVRGVTR